MGIVETKFFSYGQDDIDYLKEADAVLGAAMERIGRVDRVIIPDLFSALVHAIVGQLISAKAADTVWGRMQERFGGISAELLDKQTADDIQRCGMTMKKAVCIKTIAHTIAQGEFQLDELHLLPDQEVIQRLTTLNGVGQWTAEMLLIHSLERRNVVSWGDIAIRRGIMKLYGHNRLTKEQFEHYRQLYSPLGSIASLYLWEISFD